MSLYKNKQRMHASAVSCSDNAPPYFIENEIRNFKFLNSSDNADNQIWTRKFPNFQQQSTHIFYYSLAILLRSAFCVSNVAILAILK